MIRPFIDGFANGRSHDLVESELTPTSHSEQKTLVFEDLFIKLFFPYLGLPSRYVKLMFGAKLLYRKVNWSIKVFAKNKKIF